MGWFYSFPKKLDAFLRWRDLYCHRIDETWLHRKSFLENYSTAALWLPIPLIVALAYGSLRWRGWPLALVCLAVIAAHVAACRWAKARWLPRVQWMLILLLVAAAWWLATDGANQAASSDPYQHVFGPFAVVALALGMPACRWWADWLIGRQSKQDKNESLPSFNKVFAGLVEKTTLYVTPRRDPEESDEADRRRRLKVVRAFFLVLLESPLSLILFPAFAMLFAPADILWPAFLITLVVTWFILTAAHFDDRLQSFQILLRQVFLFGWPGFVSFIVILLAVLRVAGVDYVTTVLEQASASIIVSVVVLLYLIFWLYDYWRQRALAEVLLGILDEGPKPHASKIPYRGDGHLQIHGAGRLMAIKPVQREKHPWQFESYQPLEVFQEIHDQLEGRARASQASWDDVNRVAERVEALRQKVQLYTAVPALLLAGLVTAGVVLVFKQDQEAAYDPKPTAVTVDLIETLRTSAEEKPGNHYAIAASGGGTRAALWSYSVLRALNDRKAAGRVALLSTVSGGSAGSAYFSGHPELVGGSDAAWDDFRQAMAARYIHRVLSGVGEFRLATGTRLGRLLIDGFREEFFPDAMLESSSKDGPTFDKVTKHGVVFNSSITGSWEHDDPENRACFDKLGPESQRKCGTTRRSGTRLVLTNLRSMTDESVRSVPAAGRWNLDFDYKVIRETKVPLAAAAALSANFPPIFSNALVREGVGPNASRYWVTDGGAVENRGLVSLLLALRSEIEAASRATPATDAVKARCAGMAGQLDESDGPTASPSLPELKVLVVEASGISGQRYKEDRGLGPVAASKPKVANKLIAELASDVDRAYCELSGGSRVELVYLPMPDPLRLAWGTHWQMPSAIELADPDLWFKKRKEKIQLETEEILAAIDLLFAGDEARECFVLKSGDADRVRKLWQWLGASGTDSLESRLNAVAEKPRPDRQPTSTTSDPSATG